MPTDDEIEAEIPTLADAEALAISDKLLVTWADEMGAIAAEMLAHGTCLYETTAEGPRLIKRWRYDPSDLDLL